MAGRADPVTDQYGHQEAFPTCQAYLLRYPIAIVLWYLRGQVLSTYKLLPIMTIALHNLFYDCIHSTLTDSHLFNLIT